MNAYKVEKAPEIYYFISFINSDYPPPQNEDHVCLNGLGYFYIGHAEWSDECYKLDNTFLTKDAAKAALNQIRSALANKIENRYYLKAKQVVTSV